MSGAAVWQPLPWDTDFFGVATARIIADRLQEDTLTQTLDQCRAAGVQVLYYLAPSDDDGSVRLAEQAGFHLVDIRVTLEWQARGEPAAPVPDGLTIRDQRAEDLPGLQAIAAASYQLSRFYYDGRYPRERCDALYAEWIARSCRAAAERVLVAERRGGIAGFLSADYAPPEQTGQIRLVGISADARGQGIGHILVRAAQRWFHEQGARRVSVVTQGRNIAAQRLYQRCGFVTSADQLWYHKWFDEEDDLHP
jgi:dTDP-4-amino-4,6-dideoxy-D-galactose acyltransferase